MSRIISHDITRCSMYQCTMDVRWLSFHPITFLIIRYTIQWKWPLQCCCYFFFIQLFMTCQHVFLFRTINIDWQLLSYMIIWCGLKRILTQNIWGQTDVVRVPRWVITRVFGDDPRGTYTSHLCSSTNCNHRKKQRIFSNSFQCI